jgi:DNA-binding PadR family transcriptional regulator
MQHSFDIDIAKEYGILEAVLLNNLWYWIEKNRANETNFFDGEYWTYNSNRAFNELFPYATPRKINYALTRLQEEGLIKTGNYNQSAYDRTLWYAFTEKGKSIVQKCKMDLSNLSNGNVDFVKPIPNINTNIKPNKKPNIFVPPTLEEIEAYCKERNSTVNAKHFFDYYSEGKWVDAKGNKVRNWKQKLITWERSSKTDNKQVKQPKQPSKQEEELLKMFGG